MFGELREKVSFSEKPMVRQASSADDHIESHFGERKINALKGALR